MLAHFPAREYDDPVTRDHLDMRIFEVRTEIADLRTDTHDLIREQTTRLLTWMITTVLAAMAIMSGIALAAARSL